MRDPFVLNTTRKGDVTVLHLGGFIDAHTARDFERAIQEEVDAGHYHLVVDCARLTYISSAGLGVFMGFVEDTREHGGDIKICGLVPNVRQVFEMLGFMSIFDVQDDVASAVRRFAGAPGGEA